MINQGRGDLQQAPWIVFEPHAALFVTVLGLNFVGDAIRGQREWDSRWPGRYGLSIQTPSAAPTMNAPSGVTMYGQ